MQLFALISDIHDDTVITIREKEVIRLFLTRHLNNELVARYMEMYEEYLGKYNADRIVKDSIKDRKRTSLNAMRILAICEKINEELHQNQKIYVIVKLLDYISSGTSITENELDFLQTVADAFYISEAEYRNIKSFIMDQVRDMVENNRVLIIDNNNENIKGECKHICDPNLKGIIKFLHIVATNTYIMRYSGNEDIYLNGQNILEGVSYIFDHGSSVRGAGICTIYYTEVVSIVSEIAFESKISIDACDVSYKFRNSENGIHNLHFHEGSGKLVGILGGSGVGKSTTLSILNGTMKPHLGEVLINGYNLYDEKGKEFLKGVIGFVPQDDLLIEDLTVFQNLWYNARMCLNNLSESQILEVVNKTISDLDLDETRDLKVGNPLNKNISGGQRKRINIALELIREPTILFVDEPTSGLSSVDSEVVMNLLKEQTYKGKLVIINIHQPSSGIYKMFDKIMIIDKGGYQIFYGNPTEAIVYFKTYSNHANPYEDQCIKCGNVDADQILQIIEAKVVDEQGRATYLRKISPKEWAEKFRQYRKLNNEENGSEKQKIPENNYSVPGLAKQSKIFFIRDFLSKLADRQYLLISLLGSPLLALVLAYFTRYTTSTGYKFSENENIPAYIFMCIITSLFFGLMNSAEEIVKDRKILKRESFLNLSWFSYLNSKIMLMFLFSAFQTISFILIGNLILGIKGMTLSYWLILFTTSCFANILGLNISSAFDSVITIYIIIPFIIIPQLLFSGVLVKFDKLNSGGDPNREYVPIIGEFMTSRWSFEALAVEQFKNNKYEKPFFKYDVDLVKKDWYAFFLMDKLKDDLLKDCIKYHSDPEYKSEIENDLTLLNHYIDKISPLADTVPGPWKISLNYEKFNPDVAKETGLYLEILKKKCGKIYQLAKYRRDLVFDSLFTVYGKKKIKNFDQTDPDNKKLIDQLGNLEMVRIQEQYENKRLKELLLDPGPGDKAIKTKDIIIQKYQPGFTIAESKIGRAHFYAPAKMIGNIKIDTYWFNLTVIWLVSIMLYVTLYYKLPGKLIGWFGDLRLPKSES